MNRKTKMLIISVSAIVIIIAIAGVMLIGSARASAGKRTVMLGQFLNDAGIDQYFFGGICKTSTGTYVMTVGYNHRTQSGGTFDLFVEVEKGKQIYLGNQYVTINDFTTDSVTITTTQ